MSIASLKNVSVHFGTDTILDHVEFNIAKGERVCLTGRNGSGKSTLMRLLCGEVLADEGNIWREKALSFSTLEQDLPAGDDTTIFAAVASAFSEAGELLTEYAQISLGTFDDNTLERMAQLQTQIEAIDGWVLHHRVESVLQRMKLPPDEKLINLSGGWLKRVAIAKSLVTEPDVWLLDEPTNHLDIPTIEWLQEVMLEFQGTIVFVTHDRELMQSVATAIVEVDRGQLVRWDCDYKTFLERREHEREVEQVHNKKFDINLKKEEAWIREGIKARRTRNEGRVRALEQLRLDRQKRRTQGTLKLAVDSGSASGKIVKELVNVSKSYDGKPIITDLDLVIQRGDRIGLLGPNGSGKSTLIKILLEGLAIDAGEVVSGTKLAPAYFDQVRGQLNPEQSVKDYIAQGREYISINERDVHVVSYLANFMFNPEQARAPIRTLSGGEQNRLLLARLFSLPTNLLVLDEPTNDLDVESLELLEELLLDYTGTVLIVSHDRSFLDNVISSLLVFEGAGKVTEYVGGYNDWLQGGGSFAALANAADKVNPTAKVVVEDSSMSFDERKKAKAALKKLERELAQIPGRIDELELEMASLQAKIAAPTFFQATAADQELLYAGVAKKEAEMDSLMARWEALEQN
jgi:ABC transport system ATP-binding/permease protein|tara:strand:+ start:13450 stop:15348 length:1899 start_codon:yes stop_codon:yes gene_type:complete